ncbi:MAG: TonB-dependent receptor [Blastocatellia bacterium]
MRYSIRLLADLNKQTKYIDVPLQYGTKLLDEFTVAPLLLQVVPQVWLRFYFVSFAETTHHPKRLLVLTGGTMITINSRMARLCLALGLLWLLSSFALAQETRSAILGTVRDSAGAVVAGATVEVTQTETNSTSKLTTNDSGYFEARYLLPGTYSISVTASGFKKYLQQGYQLTVNSRQNINITLEVGGASETVTITATSGPLLETTSGSGTASLEQRQISDLPVMSNSAILLARGVPGMQWTAQPNYLGMHSNAGGSAVSAAGNVGGNEFSLDGVPNMTQGRRTGALPYTDTVAEFKVETAPFDASKGHTSGATISLSTKSGTNDYHGQLTWQHWQQRLNATQSTTNAGYWSRIRQAEAAGNTALANQLQSVSPQPTGRSNNWAGSVGGPVRVPWLFNGRDKLFFFFGYNAAKDVKTEEANQVNRTVPSDLNRSGDFSDLLKIDPVRYQIYDPRTARLVNGVVTRDPFPNNKVPILNPMYKYYEALYPKANNVPGVVSAEGVNNYLAAATPFNWDYKAFTNRVDLNLTSKQKMFGKWTYTNFSPEDRGDWTYETARGLQMGALVRKNIGITFDHVYTVNSTTIFNWSIAWNRFIEGNASNATQTSFPPSKVGLPSYLDQKAGSFIHLPSITFTTYSSMNRGYPGFSRYSTGTLRGEFTKYLGTHALRIGTDNRNNWRASNGPGQSSASFNFGNSFVRQAQNTANAGTLGLEWAAFMLGVPTSISIDTNDSAYLTNQFYGVYAQDDWKLSPKLTLNLGLRYELEGSFHERFNRGLYGFDLNATLPITAGAQAAYANLPASILALRPASDFVVKGGNLYLGKDGAPTGINNAQGAWMPRVGFAYQLNDKTVLRGGYGLFFDTNNVIENGVDQSGYSRSTGTTITNDNGLSFNNANWNSAACKASSTACVTVLADPFPVRADGTRFNVPLGNALGLMARQGRGFTFLDPNWERARQQRWRLGLQRQIGNVMVLEVAYLGSYSDNIQVSRRLDALPGKYWATGLIRNNAVNTDLSTSFTNPFNIANFASLATSNPTLYADMQSNGFFTGTTISKAQLLRPYPNINNLVNGRDPGGKNKYHHLEVTATKRFSQGMAFQASYQWASNLAGTRRENEFDENLVWEPNNNAAPHNLNLNFIYEFPFGKGRKYLANNKWLNAVVGGWQIGGIYNKQSGRIYNTGNWFYYGSDLRALAKPTKDQTVDAWFNWQLLPGAARDYSASNRTAYETRIRSLVPQSVLTQMGNICGSSSNQACTYENVIPTNFQPNNFHSRIFPNALNWLRGMGKNQFDANILRRFPITEKKMFEFRLDLLNAFNHVLWDNPNTDITSTNFGKVTTQWNTPRFIQFQLRLTF